MKRFQLRRTRNVYMHISAVYYDCRVEYLVHPGFQGSRFEPAELPECEVLCIYDDETGRSILSFLSEEELEMVEAYINEEEAEDDGY